MFIKKLFSLSVRGSFACPRGQIKLTILVNPIERLKRDSKQSIAQVVELQ